MTTAGGYNRRITIEREGEGQDEIGQPITGWTVFATVWASIKHPTGIQAVRADAEASIVKASIRIRYRLDVVAGMRVMHAGRVYDIKAALPDEEKRQHVDLVCELTGAANV